MNAVSEDVKMLVEKELESANERFPQFHSEHEGWAIITEEAEELREECASIEMAMEQLWHRIRDGIQTAQHVALVEQYAEAALLHRAFALRQFEQVLPEQPHGAATRPDETDDAAQHAAGAIIDRIGIGAIANAVRVGAFQRQQLARFAGLRVQRGQLHGRKRTGFFIPRFFIVIIFA